MASAGRPRTKNVARGSRLRFLAASFCLLSFHGFAEVPKLSPTASAPGSGDHAGLAAASKHAGYMRLAIAEAKKAKHPFGAVIVDMRTGEVLAASHNQSEVDPTLHGEIAVIQECARKHPGIDWQKTALYTTAEPCAMCQGAIEWTGIKAVYFGSSVPFLKSQGMWQIDLRAQEIVDKTPFRKTELHPGILEEECNRLYRKR